MRKKLIVIICVLTLAFLVTACEDESLSHFANDGKKASSQSNSEQSSKPYKNTVFVYVCGEVNLPGVYELSEGSRIKDAIDLAGGLTSDADSTAINQAAVVKDQDKIVVAAVNESSGTGGSTKLININTASKEQLMTLSGIGESKAENIISYREKNGGFKSTEDLMKIEGIKTSVYNKVKDKISVN